MFSGIRLLQFLFVGTSLLLAIYPYADIWFSDLFYKGNNQFVVQHYLVGRAYFYEFIIREIMMPLIVFLLLFFPIIVKFSGFLKKRFISYNLKLKDIGFIWTSVIMLTFVVSFLLKGLWGRARPVDTTIFDGEKIFASWIFYSDQCQQNCSFVSGDATVGFFIVVLYYITNKQKFFYAGIIAGLLIGVLRIGSGAHFLSDVLMSFVVVNIILKINQHIFFRWTKAKL